MTMTTRTKIARVVRQIFVAVAITGTLTGCANNCNIFSTTNSFGCSAEMLAGFIVTAPLLPMEDAKRRDREEAEKKDFLAMKEGVKNGDLASLERCVDRCNSYLVFMDEKHELRKQAAIKLVAMDTPELPQERVTAMMVAYSLLVWSKDADDHWGLDHGKVMRGWELASRYRLQEPFGATVKETLSHLAEEVFVSKLQTLPEASVQQAFANCMTDTLLPTHPDQNYRTLLCGSSYRTYYRLHDHKSDETNPPKWLENKWAKDDNAMSIEASEARWRDDDPQHRKVVAGVRAGERAALEWCVVHCPKLSDMSSRSALWDQRTLQREAGKKLIELDAAGKLQGATPDQIDALIEAYQHWLWRVDPGGKLDLDTAHITRAWELASSSPAGINARSSGLASYVFVTRLVGLPKEEILTAFENCVIEDRLPAYSRLGASRPALCWYAYKYYGELSLGVAYLKLDRLESRWKKDWDDAKKSAE